ncbi:MAG TPA: NAD(P)/FAD-dependent oxidoreductase [Candidatus Elarobacter sp.]|nr:NAD(P)/FAD-dependent oxidoreductase [Candidatus Elarobacter sp.]
MELHADVAVLGAGAAGLAAARVLSQAGASAIVLEARDRIGGRILTHEDAGLAIPFDVGGEFIHGAAPVTFDLLRAANMVAIDTAGAAFAYEDGALRDREDPFEIVAGVMARARSLPEDVSVDTFLRSLPDGDPRSERERRYTRMLVEGFDAADPRRAGVRALADEWAPGDDESQTSAQFRPLGGYTRLLRSMVGALDPRRAHVRLSTVVQHVSRDGDEMLVDAVVRGAQLRVRARAAIVTLPVGVLQADAVRFTPELPAAKRDALGGLIMGPVVKLGLRFRSAFWERAQDGRFRDGSFFHRAEAAFPTFWNMLPLRAPQLVAWAGGPKADALAGRDRAALVACALDDLRALFGNDPDPAVELEAAYAHDWQDDPYARGAYSYVATGGGDARARLAAPIDAALFFAGEATAPAGEAGTVAGALLTGERAAREALAARVSAGRSRER